MRKVLAVLFILVLVIGAGLGIARYSQRNSTAQLEATAFDTPEQAMAKVRELLAEDTQESAEGALRIVARYSENILGDSAVSKQWEDLLIETSLKARNYQLLMKTYDLKPSIADGREDISLIIADALIFLKRPQDYEDLKSKWLRDSAHPGEWFLKDGMLLASEGKTQEAIKHLNSQELKGDLESTRLMRLALLVSKTNAKEAWTYLEEAKNKDPKNTSVRVLRARLLELVNQGQHAIAELRTAIQLEPENPLLYDQLAEVYKRMKQTSAAIATWTEALKYNPPPQVALKIWFWTRVFTPAEIEWPETKTSKDPLQALLAYYQSLPEDSWWDEQELDRRGNLGKFLNQHESTLWLRVLDHLSRGEEIQALKLLQHRPIEESGWAPELHLGLLRILTYRLEGFLPEPGMASIAEIQHPFFTQIDDAAQKGTIDNPATALPADIAATIKSPFAFSAAFLAAGWLEAAYELSPSDIVPANLPPWVSYGLTQTVRKNRGAQEALLYASKQQPSDALTLLTSEIMIQEQDYPAAYVNLKEIASKGNRIGIRAAYLMTQLDMMDQRFERAVEVLDSYPHLANSVLGKETRARIHLALGEGEQARTIYESIQDSSFEAVSYLAKMAYDKGDLRKAKELTAQMLSRDPNNPVLRKNYMKLVEELNEAGQKQ